MKRHGQANILVTDKLRSCGAAMKVLGNAEKPETDRWLNNRSENSHQPFRRRERAMQRCRFMRTLQKFAPVPSTPRSATISTRSAVSTADRISRPTAPPLWAAARNHPGCGPHHRHRTGRQHPRSGGLQVRPSVRSLPRAGAATELVGRQEPAGADLENRQWLLASLARGRSHFRHPQGRDQHHKDRILGAVAPGPQTRAGDHGGDGQQDRAHRLGGSDTRRNLSRLTNRMR